MTRLKTILLAGTIVPALVLPPLSPGWAQMPPGAERGPGGAPGRGAGEPGGPHGGGAGGPHGGMGAEGPRGGGAGGPHGGMGAEGPRGGAPGAGRAERGGPGGARGGEPGEARAPHPERTGGGERAREPAAERAQPPRAAPAERAAEQPPRATSPAERSGERPGAPGHGGTAAERAERPNAPGRANAPAERAAERPAAPAGRVNDPASPQGGGFHNGDNSRGNAYTGHGGPVGERPGMPGRAGNPADHAGERAGEPGRPGNPAERAGERHGEPGRAGNPADHAGERPGEAGRPGNPGAPAPAQGAGRVNDPASPQGGGFRNGDNSRGDAATGRGRDNGFDRRDDGNRRGGISPGGAAAIGAAAGFAGGFLAATGARDLEGIRRDRREVYEDGRTYIREPGRTIIDEGGGRAFIVHDENDRFRDLGYDVRRERRGDDYVDVINRPGGEQVLTFTTPDGRLLRRVRRDRDGREIVLIDNSFNGGIRSYRDDVVDLPPPRFDIPRDRYYVDYARADEGEIYDTLVAPPVAPPPRRYTLDQIRYSPDIRRYVRSVDINTINFASGSWIVPASATGKLQALGAAIKRAVAQNPNSVFLVEGYTDATGNPNDNLSLSDRRAQSVAAILSKDFGVPPENLTTQGYGQQNLKVNTPGPSAENRRVVVQNITQLMAENGNNAPR